MYCYRCGCELTGLDFCPKCGADVTKYKKIVYASNYFYNDGLDKAKVRDLSGAISSLLQSIRLYKYNLDARNLLGLVYYEIGETVAALSEWVISSNLKPEKNVAKEYLDLVQNDKNRLETLSLTIRKYNKALEYANQDGLDLAMIQLKKVLQMNPHYLRPRQLLALLYINSGDYAHAKNELEKCLAIDSANTTSLRYLKEAESLVAPEDAEAAPADSRSGADGGVVKYKDGNETIIQPAGTKNPGVESSPLPATLINIGIGLLVGAAIVAFFVMPARISAIRTASAAQVSAIGEVSDKKSATITEQQTQIDDLNATNKDLQSQLDKYKSTSGTLSSDDALFKAAETYLSNPTDTASVAAALEAVNYDTVKSTASAEYTSFYEAFLAKVRPDVMKYWYDSGYAAYGSTDYVTAITDLTNAVKYGDAKQDESYPGALFYLADSYYMQYRNASSEEQSKFEDDLAIAQEDFGKVTTDYPDTKFATDAETKLNEINLLKKSTTDTATDGSNTAAGTGTNTNTGTVTGTNNGTDNTVGN
jgi:tetratricopeptide (TPR) repeat protein